MNGPSGFQEVRSSAPRSSTNRLLHEQRPRYGKVPGAFSVLLMLLAFAGHIAFHTEQAHGVTSITHTTGAGDLGTLVLPPIGHVYGITGGTPAGTNLYHSFAQFNVGTGDIAQFQTGTIPNIEMLNILGRITDANPSTIFGTIDSATFYPNANLFLMNPYGFLFGPGAMVNVGGMVAFTTADYLRLTNDVRFEAIPGAQDVLLSALPVAAFGFLGANPAAIAVQGSHLTVASGTGLSLVGGNQGFTAIDPDTGNPISVPEGVTMTGGTLSAPGGQINLASVASPGEVSAGDFIPTSGMTMGKISLSQGATLDVSDNAAGTVRIRGGQFELLFSSVHADTGEAPGAETAIDVYVTGDLSISSDSVSAFTARALGSGNAGEIRLDSAKMDVNMAFPEFGVVIDSSTIGSGNAGKVTVTTGDLKAVFTSTSGQGIFIDSGTGGTGNGGDVTIKMRNGDFIVASINTGDTFFSGTGSAGSLYIGGKNGMADSLHTDGSNFSTDAFSAKGGAITLEAHDINLTVNTTVESVSLLGKNPITIHADQLRMDTVVQVVAATSGAATGGDIVFTGKRLEMSNESNFITSTFSDGNAGNIRVDANEYVRIAEDPRSFTPSGLYSDSIGSEGVTTSGNAGSIDVITPRFEMTGGARINTTTHTAGRGGDVTITASEGLFISGQRTNAAPADSFGLGEGNGSGIYTRTVGTDQCGGTCGRGGDQIITTGHLVLQNGGVLDSGTTGNGNGGNIAVNASNDIVLSGTLIDGTPSGIFSRTIGTASNSGTGGNIDLTAGQSVTISNGASVSASSTGAGDAGNVTIQGLASPAESVLIDGSGSGLFTDTQGTGAGGNIFVNANSVTLQNGGTLSAATSGTVPEAIGGTITIAATDVQLSNGALVTAQTTSAGNAGNILVQADSVSITGGAQITSSSVIGDSGEIPTGNAGNITIQGLAGSAESVLISGVSLVGDILQPGGIFTTTSGTGTGGNISIAANTVTIQNGARLDAKSAGPAPEARAGDIAVTADQFTLAQGAQINSSTFGPGSGGNVTIDAGQVQLIGSGTTIKTESNGAGHAGNVSMTANQVLADTAEISANTSGTGNAGNISILTNPAPGLVDEVHLTNGAKISSTTQGTGLGGDIHVKTSNLTLENASITSATVFPLDSIGGNAGTILAEVDTLTMTGGIISTQSLFSSGRAGNVTINATTSASISGSGDTQGAIFTSTQGGPGDAGDITLTVGALNLTNGAQVFAGSQSSSGNGGSVTVTAGDSVLISGSGEFQGTAQASGIIASSTFFSTGHAGQVTVTAPSVVVENGGVISTSTDGAGNARNITVKADTVSLTGGGHLTSSSVLPFGPEFPEFVPTGSAGTVSVQGQHSPAQSVLIDGPGSGIFTDTQGTGAGGSIFVNANTVTLQNGGTLSATTSGTEVTATGGTITVDAANTVTMNSASISASSAGTANAGSINITGINGITMQNSTVTTQAGQGAGGGDITVTTSPDATVLLQNSKISASVADGRGGGGNISIDPQFVILQNSQILAQAAQGQGGAITIFANLFLSDANSIVNADSGSGVNGTVTIQSPNAPISGQFQPLGKTPLIATSLFNQRCASLAGGEFSSFTVAGRDSLPTEPGSWLASPLYAAGVGLGIKAEGVKAEGERLEGLSASAGRGARGESLFSSSGLFRASNQRNETNQINQMDQIVLSLRQIAPAGFLTQAFAVDEPAGCRS